MRNLTRRSFIGVVGASALAMAGSAVLAGCGGQQSAQEQAQGEAFMQEGKGQHLIIGRRNKLFKIAPNVIAEKLGYFEEEGCDVEFQQVELAEGFASLSTGKLDGMLMGVVQTCEYIAKGSPMYIFGGSVLNGTEILAMESFDKKLEKPEDFKGLRIGMHRPETGQMKLRSWLKNNGIDLENDIQVIFMDSEQALVEGLVKGELDIALVNNAFGYINLDRGVRVIGAVKDLTGDYPCCRQNASEKAYKEKYLSLVDFEIAMLRGYKVFETDPDQAVSILAEYSEQKEDYVRAAMYGTDTYRALMDPSLDPCRNDVLKFYDDLKAVEQIDGAAPSADEFVVTSIYRTALDTMMEREPDEQLWKELDAYYKEHDE